MYCVRWGEGPGGPLQETKTLYGFTSYSNLYGKLESSYRIMESKQPLGGLVTFINLMYYHQIRISLARVLTEIQGIRKGCADLGVQ